MTNHTFTKKKGTRKTIGKTIVSFALTFLLLSLLIGFSILNRMRIEKLMMEQLIVEKSVKANEVLSHLLYKTRTLSTFVLKSREATLNFEQMAAILMDDPSILNVLIAPNGIVTDVYPLEGNEAVIGMDFFGEGAGNKEAVLARETGQLVLGGPFEAVQGGRVLVGRLPVFYKETDGTEAFWGLVSITLKYPQVLDAVGLNELPLHGYEYEIWRLNPDDGERQIIADSGYKHNDDVRYIEQHAIVQNADWYFRILPVRSWYQYPDSWLLIFLGLLISALVSFVIQSNGKLKVLKSNFENLSRMDPLTGIYNRRTFLEFATSQMDQCAASNANAFIIIFDIDHFKKVNDVYGHLAGDDVLKGFALRVNENIRPQDLFSRYGGEEFIILATDIDKENAINLAERLRLAIMEKPFESDHKQIPVTASFGIAYIASPSKFKDSVDLADKALYTAKKEGRNRVVFYDHEGVEED